MRVFFLGRMEVTGSTEVNPSQIQSTGLQAVWDDSAEYVCVTEEFQDLITAMESDPAEESSGSESEAET